SPFVFRCDDSRKDRCSQPSAPQNYARGAGLDINSGALNTVSGPGSGANLVANFTDPFPQGEAYPFDSTLEIEISKAYLASLAGKLGNKYPAINNANPTLVNVCSYPSAGSGGNNNPFDCIVTPGSGFLKITNVAHDGTTQDISFHDNNRQ